MMKMNQQSLRIDLTAFYLLFKIIRNIDKQTSGGSNPRVNCHSFSLTVEQSNSNYIKVITKLIFQNLLSVHLQDIEYTRLSLCLKLQLVYYQMLSLYNANNT